MVEEKSTVEGLVLQTIDYQNNDGIIHLFTPDEGIVSLFGRGIQKESSKNRRLSLPFSKVSLNYDPRYSHSMLYLVNGSVLESYFKAMDSLEMQTINALVVSLIERYGGDKLNFLVLEKMWAAFHNQELSQGILLACLLVSDALAQEGILMNVDQCMVCGRTTRLAGLSFLKGGFVCVEHQDEKTLILPRERLLQLRKLVKAIEALRTLDFRLEESQMLLDVAISKLSSFLWDIDFLIILLEWYSTFTNTRLASLDFLKSLPIKKNG